MVTGDDSDDDNASSKNSSKRNGGLSAPMDYSEIGDSLEIEDIENSSYAERPPRNCRPTIFRWLAFMALLTYSCTAFIVDFKRAQGLFWAELCVGSFLFLQWFWAACPATVERLNDVKFNIGNQWDRSTLFRCATFALLSLCVGLIIAFCTYNEPSRLISGFGLVVYGSVSFAFSWKRNAINWRPVLWGFGLQFVLALLILRTDVGFHMFDFVGSQISVFLNFSHEGAAFTFGFIATGYESEDGNVNLPAVFAFAVLPTVVFFSAVTSMLYYLGLLQAVVKILGVGLSHCMGTSVSESFNAAGNIFVGQTEAPLLVRPFIETMTLSELHAVMTGGFATIAGGVMAAYIALGVSATHLLTASVMSAPAALAVSKLVYPETEQSASRPGTHFHIPRGTENNMIEAASNGASLSVGLVGNIAANLIAFLALIACADAWVGYFGGLVGWDDASFSSICSIVFFPAAWLMGVDGADCREVGRLLGVKMFANEFVAYKELLELLEEGELSQRSAVIATYALCGFSNFGSMGMQIAGLGSLAPSRRADLSRLVLSAMVSGNVACWFTACIAGMLYDSSRDAGGG